MPDHALPNRVTLTVRGLFNEIPMGTRDWWSTPVSTISWPLAASGWHATWSDLLPDETSSHVNPNHPATFSEPILEAIRHILLSQRFQGTILDPFAGTGGIHMLTDDHRQWRTVGVEIEPEWAACAPGTMVGDALHLDRLTLPVIDAIVTSPCYGNRMADRYRGQNDTCTECRGSGQGDGETLGLGVQIRHCPACGGSGRRASRRYGYSMSLGRDPTEGSSAAMQWGDAYRRFHSEAVMEWLRLLYSQTGREENLVIVNVSDHIRHRQEQGVHLWWASMLGRHFGVDFTAVPVETHRQRHGQNGEARVSCEWLLWARV